MEKIITKWIEKGLLTKETAISLLADYKIEKLEKRKIKINITIYTIAAILIGTGIISFVSANDWILELLNASEILKISLMFAATVFSFWGGYKLAYENNKCPKLGQSLIILSSLLIGGTYALIGQTYNINANNSTLMFLWLISIIPIAYLFKNYAINVLSIVLFILGTTFFYWDLNIDKGLVWTIFVPVLFGTILYTVGNIPIILKKYNDFSLSYKLVGLVPIFITLMVLTCSVENSYNLISPYYIIPVILLIVGNIINFMLNNENNKLLKIETLFMVSLLGFLLLLLILPQISIPFTMILTNIILISIICFGFNYGYKFEHGKIIGLTNWFLIIYLVVNYCRWGWSYMDKTLFFILGGVCLLLLGIFLERKKKNFEKGENNE